jgi:hypothetical protein
VNYTWQSVRDKKAANIHQQCGYGVEMVLKASVFKRTLDNITVVMIAFENFKKITHPSPIRGSSDERFNSG